jgi:ribose transport system permease protein
MRDQRAAASVASFVEQYSIFVAWALVIAVFWALRPETFGTPDNFLTIFGSQSALVIAALGALVVLTAGEFDLSVGAVLGLGASLFAHLTAAQDVPVAVAIAVVTAAGCAAGLVNALLVVRLGVSSMVATLGTGTLVAGVTLGVVGPSIQAGVPDGFVELVAGEWLGLPRSFYFATLACVAVWYVLEHTPLGRYLDFVGRGREVARLAGIRVAAVRALALVTASVAAVWAGIVLAGTTGSVQSGIGGTFLLPVYAAAFLGATTVRPGSFNVWGTYASVFFLVTGITGLQLTGAAGWPEQVFYGGSLVLAVTLSRVAAAARERRARAVGEPVVAAEPRSEVGAVEGSAR